MAYVSEIAKGSSAEKICSSWKATRNQIRGAYFVSIDKEKVFTREDVVRVLKRLFTEQVKEFEVEFAPERRLSASQMRKSFIEHSQVLFNPEADMDQDHVPQLTINYIWSIAKHLHPDTDCTEDTVSDEEVVICINAVQSRAMTEEEEALGVLTRRKLKSLSTWPEWQAGEFKQLDRFHALRMYGEPIARPTDPAAIVLRPLWQYKGKNTCAFPSKSSPATFLISTSYETMLSMDMSTSKYLKACTDFRKLATLPMIN